MPEALIKALSAALGRAMANAAVDWLAAVLSGDEEAARLSTLRAMRAAKRRAVREARKG
jgi:23S rRNA G2445 N2-methylase RlmL